MIKINNQALTNVSFFWIILFIYSKKISCFLISKSNDWFSFFTDFLLLNDLCFERFLRIFRRVIEKTLFKWNENRIFIRVIIVCAFEAMFLSSSLLITLFRAFLLLSTIFKLKRNWDIFFVCRIMNLIFKLSNNSSSIISTYTTHRIQFSVSNFVIFFVTNLFFSIYNQIF